MATSSSSSTSRKNDRLLLAAQNSSGVLRLTLNDPATRNSLSEAMMAALAAVLASAATDRDVRVIVLAATGPAFSSGHNLKEITAHRGDADKGAAYFATLFDHCAALMTVDRPAPEAGDRRGPGPGQCRGLPAGGLAAISPSPRTPPASARPASISDCSAPPRWWRCRAMSRPSMPWRCCSPAMSSTRARPQRIGLVNRVVPANELGEVVASSPRRSPRSRW